MLILAAALLLFFCSLLIFFDLKYPLLWKLSLAATEYGHWFAAAPLTIIIFSGLDGPLNIFSVFISSITIIILFYPVFSAIFLSRSLRQRMNGSFGTHESFGSDKSPFSLIHLWFGGSVPKVHPETHIYAHNGSEEQYLRFFRARSSSSAPCIIVIHTGGWDSGSPDEFATMNHYLASRGYAVASISYRFAPKWQWPAQKEDTLSALSYLKKNAMQLGIDPSQFVLFGRSAGGQIAEATAYTAPDPSIKGCIAFYAPADMNFAYEHLSPEPDILDSRTLLQNYLGGPQETVRMNYDDASPYDHITSQTPSTLLIHGSKDPLTWYRQSERLSHKLAEHSVPHLYIELPWGTHAFDYNFNGPGGQISRYAVERFLCSIVYSSTR